MSKDYSVLTEKLYFLVKLGHQFKDSKQSNLYECEIRGKNRKRLTAYNLCVCSLPLWVHSYEFKKGKRND